MVCHSATDRRIALRACRSQSGLDTILIESWYCGIVSPLRYWSRRSYLDPSGIWAHVKQGMRTGRRRKTGMEALDEYLEAAKSVSYGKAGRGNKE